MIYKKDNFNAMNFKSIDNFIYNTKVKPMKPKFLESKTSKKENDLNIYRISEQPRSYKPLILEIHKYQGSDHIGFIQERFEDRGKLNLFLDKEFYL